MASGTENTVRLSFTPLLSGTISLDVCARGHARVCVFVCVCVCVCLSVCLSQFLHLFLSLSISHTYFFLQETGLSFSA